MNFQLISSVLLFALLGSITAYRSPFAQVAQRYEEQEPIEQQTVYSYGAPAAYRFAYSTPEGLLSRSSSSGSSSRYVQQTAEGGSSSNYAQLAHEQSSDGSGEVVGRYAYVDPYGKLRVVNYRAGRNGYQASGDIGPDEEALRQQQELYANDVSYQLQQQAWQQVARGEPVNIGAGIQQAVYSGASSAAAASSAASSGGSQTEWQEVNQGSGSSANYATKNSKQQFAERYTAAGGLKSPSAQLRQQSTVSQSVDSTKSVQQSSSAASASAAASSAAYTAPQVTSYSTKTVHQPVQVKTVQTTYQYQAPAHIVVQPQKLILGKSVQSTKSVQQQQISGFQSPAARLVALSNGAASSSSASASAAASASASSSGDYTAGVKGYSGAIKSAPLRVAPVKVARYVSQPTGGRTVVNFSQGGPVPYNYSYSFK